MLDNGQPQSHTAMFKYAGHSCLTVCIYDYPTKNITKSLYRKSHIIYYMNKSCSTFTTMTDSIRKYVLLQKKYGCCILMSNSPKITLTRKVLIYNEVKKRTGHTQ